jgi:coenzyme PQQ precursor peptide PqqA
MRADYERPTERSHGCFASLGMTRLVGEITQSGRIPHLNPPVRNQAQSTQAAICSQLTKPPFTPKILAHHLHLSGRRRVHQRSDWVVAPNRQSVPTTLSEDEKMKWTKPEAEIVAVTMEVTAYVATL